jgi:hypothetical protein
VWLASPSSCSRTHAQTKKTTVQPPWAGSGSRGPRRGHGDCASGGFKLACASPGRALGVRQGGLNHGRHGCGTAARREQGPRIGRARREHEG